LPFFLGLLLDGPKASFSLQEDILTISPVQRSEAELSISPTALLCSALLWRRLKRLPVTNGNEKANMEKKTNCKSSFSANHLTPASLLTLLLV